MAACNRSLIAYQLNSPARAIWTGLFLWQAGATRLGGCLSRTDFAAVPIRPVDQSSPQRVHLVPGLLSRCCHLVPPFQAVSLNSIAFQTVSCGFSDLESLGMLRIKPPWLAATAGPFGAGLGVAKLDRDGSAVRGTASGTGLAHHVGEFEALLGEKRIDLIADGLGFTGSGLGDLVFDFGQR